jgi:type VI secretion system Hcp family effector
MVFRENLRLVIVSLAFAVGALTPDVSWAVDAYLKITGCDGPETRKGFEKQIHLAGFNSRVHSATGSTGGTNAGRAVIQPIEVLHDLDACSPQFFLDTVLARRIDQATITFVRDNQAGLSESYFQISLQNVVITGVESMTVSNGERTVQDAGAIEINQNRTNGTAIQEVVTLSFGSMILKDLISNKTITFSPGRNPAF